MPIQGNLRDFSATQLLNLINLSGRTGILKIFEGIPTGEKDAMQNPKLAAGQERAQIFFRGGKLVFASLTDQLGDLVAVLTKAGKLNEAQGKVLRERAAGASDKALALRLINANYVTKNDIIASTQKYILEIIYDVAIWNQEMFRFDDNVQPSDDRILVPIDLENVIMDIAKRIQKVDEINKHIENLDMCLKFPENPREKFENVHLSVEEWKVVSYVNPKNTIRQIAKQNNMSDMEIRRIVYGLEQAGLVEIIKPEGMEQKKRPGAKPRPNAAKQPVVQKATVSKLIDKLKSM